MNAAVATARPASHSVAAPVAATAPALVRIEGLHKVYGAGDTFVHALRGVDLTLREGEFVAVMGSSGSGKSTFMNMLGALDRPTEGRYWFRGVDVGPLGRDERALLRRHYLSFVFQSFNLLPRTTALENVELPLIYRGVRKAARRKRAMEMLAMVGLADRADHTPAQLSGGQQQRVAIARALTADPALILADEPTGNLDSARSAEIMELLVRLQRERGLTIAMVTHEPEMAAYAGRVLWFEDGLVKRDGTPAEVLG